MRLVNYTKHRIPRQWLEKMLNHLGVNPLIEINYSDDPEVVTKPNYRVMIGRNYSNVDGLADDKNRVYIYAGVWQDGVLQDYTLKYIKWILLHELRHQYYYYTFGNSLDPWKGIGWEQRIKREERACNRFANLIMGVPDKDFKILKKDVKKKPATKKTNNR